MIQEIFGAKEPQETVSELSYLLNLIRKHRGITLDDLCAMTGSEYSRISLVTGMLEMEGLISVDLLHRCTANTRIYR